MRTFFLFCIVSIATAKGFSQPATDTLSWKSASEIMALQKQSPRPVLIDIYTDWCHWCHVMDATTYHNDTIVQYLNKHFYCMRLNAESPEEIVWQGKTYHYLPQYKVHELAVFFTSGNIVYPSTIIISDDKAMQVTAGYLEVQAMNDFLRKIIKL